MTDLQLNKSQKLVKMVELMSRRGGVRAQDFMQRFDLDARTLRRYLADLRDMEIPLEDHGWADNRVISISPTYRRSGVQLTLPEVLSLHFGRKLFNFLEGTQFAADMNDALERLSPAISRAHADLARDLDRKFFAVSEHAKDYREIGETLDEIVTSLIYENPARVAYGRADMRSFDLEPYTLAVYRQGLYLFGRDRRDGRIKTYAVERFTRFDRLRLEKFTIPADYNPEEVVANAFGIISGVPDKVSLLFDEDVALYVQERRWHKSQRTEQLPDGRVRLEMQVALTTELLTWVLGFAGSVVVEGPEALRQKAREAHTRALSRLK